MKETLSVYLLKKALKLLGFVYECKSLQVKELKDLQSGKIRYLCGGYVFPSFNRPRRYAGNNTFTYSVLAKEGEEVTLLHYGHKFHNTSSPSLLHRRRKSFRKLLKYLPHTSLKKNSPLYWASEYPW